MQNPIAASIDRLKSVISRRPEFAVHDDAPATARWESGTRVSASHANGHTMTTDMPAELGGEGQHVTPGWMFRAGIASCTATRIAMAAAEQGIVLTHLEVVAGSTSDARGMLGVPDENGAAIPAGASEVRLDVHISASGVEEARLRRLVHDSHPLAPMSSNIERSVPLNLSVTIGQG
jgi:uncharacterized OsmC-like protein